MTEISQRPLFYFLLTLLFYVIVARGGYVAAGYVPESVDQLMRWSFVLVITVSFLSTFKPFGFIGQLMDHISTRTIAIIFAIMPFSIGHSMGFSSLETEQGVMAFVTAFVTLIAFLLMVTLVFWVAHWRHEIRTQQ